MVWDGLDKFLDWSGQKLGSVLDYLNTKELSEAQIAQARAQEATAAATQSAVSAGVLSSGITPVQAAALGIAAFAAYKMLK